MIEETSFDGARPSTLEGEQCSRTRESRKKFRREPLWKRSKAHKNRNLGKEYLDRKGKLHAARVLKEYPHRCRFNCNGKIPDEKRKEVFAEYWNLGNHDLQTSFTFSSTILSELERKKKGDQVRKRKISTEYTLCGERAVSYTHLDVYKRQVYVL